MDLNIVKIVNQVNGTDYVRYVSGHALKRIDVCILATEAKLFTTRDAEQVVRDITFSLSLSDTVVSIVSLGTVDNQPDLIQPKGDLKAWYEVENLDRSRLIRFLEGNTNNLTMQSSRMIHGSHQFFVGEHDGLFQVIVSLPGYWSSNQLSDSIDYHKYGFSGYQANSYGTGKGLFTVFTFTE